MVVDAVDDGLPPKAQRPVNSDPQSGFIGFDV
jgi:hypothetical protein